MSDNEKNKILMYEMIITYLLENKDVISYNPSFSNAISKLKEATEEIKLKDTEIFFDVLGKTIIANKAREVLILTVIPVTASLYNFAKEKNNIELKEKTRLTRSHFARLRDFELINQSFAIMYNAKKNLYGLGKYGITKKSIQELNIKILRFKNALNNKSITFASGSTTLSLNELYYEAENILKNQLDKLVEPFSMENEEFYNDYLSIRSMEYFEETEEEEEYSLEEEVVE
jgi:hypothetical protein